MGWPLAYLGSVVIVCFTLVWLRRMDTAEKFRAVAAYQAYELQKRALQILSRAPARDEDQG